MKHLLPVVILILLVSCLPDHKQSGYSINLAERWDTIRPLENPHKGWYHHMLDNGIDKYLIADDSLFLSFPGMDHLYLRLAWAYLEPTEGKFDWSYIDNIVEKYVPLGYGISFRITTKETGPAPGSVPEEVEGVRYATPYWVVEAGARGNEKPEFGTPSWTPYWNDPVFLEKLDNFHKAFAERYDGKPWVRYVDVGSIGEWGEGHTHFSTRIPPTVEEIKTHMDIHLKHYKHSQLVVTDDLIYWNKPEQDVKELFNYAKTNGFTMRDDSPLVEWYVSNNLDTWSVSHPHFFEELYRSRPTVFELQHYGSVKTDGNWLGRNGEDTIPATGVSGAEIFRNAMRLIHPTYIGYHGYAEEWLADNPELTVQLLNLCGYWYFPVTATFNDISRREISFSISWLNKGVAPAYDIFSLRGRLIPVETTQQPIEFEIEDSGNKSWMPGETTVAEYSVALKRRPKGEYRLGVQLFDRKSGRTVETGIQQEWVEDGYFLMDTVTF